ncbi:DUF6233 domain-containing protein [Streptomyces fagopyri]|uniref:DUF6233 domain-containing protein n=1 Tax=Streptomyces fagopyri TaxID=2662397 RepID=UPI00367F14B8
MSELPPDPARLHAILTHIDRQLADTETIATYLRLQRQEVQRALNAAGRPPARTPRPAPAPRPARSVERRPNAPTGRGDGFMLESKRHPKDPRPAMLHVDDCTMANQATSPITVDQFRVGLRDTEHMEPCGFCMPENKLSDSTA